MSYQRLTRAYPRRGFSISFMSRVSLWLGPDHLLLSDRIGYTETYKRFYFQDIQAIILRQTNRYAAWNAVLAALLGLSLVGLLMFLFGPGKSIAGSITCGLLAALFFIPLVINLLLGPTCSCYLRTAVQNEDLPPLRRVRQTQKFLNKLNPLILAAQGGENLAPTISPAIPDGTTSPPVEPPPPLNLSAATTEVPPRLDN